MRLCLFMKHIILFDSDIRDALLPLTYTRPIAEIRLGILTIREKWASVFRDATFSYITSDYLEPLFPIDIQDDNLLINGGMLPTDSILPTIRHLQKNEAIMVGDDLIAARLSQRQFELLLNGEEMEDLVGYEVSRSDIEMIEVLSKLVDQSHQEIGPDMQRLGLDISPGHSLDIPGTHPVYVDPTAKVERALIRADDGPVYIGPHAQIMDGACLRGPISIGEGSLIKSHAVLIKGVCIGPNCEIGGEIKRSLFLGYSNKSHEGYVGDAVVGEWCNLGALTTNSNLKNTFSEVKHFHYSEGRMVGSGSRKMGFIMGDYCRTAIMTTINAGTSIGVSCHVYGQGVASGLIPSFVWGGIESEQVYHLEKAVNAASIFRSFKGHDMPEELEGLLRRLYEMAEKA